MELLEYFSPSALGIKHYGEIWILLLNTLFSGFFSRLVAWSCLILAVFSIARRRFSLVTSFALYAVAMVFAYGGFIWEALSG